MARIKGRKEKLCSNFLQLCPLSCLLLYWNPEIFSFKGQVNKHSPAMLSWKMSDYTGRGCFSIPDFPSLTCPARDWVLVWVKRISAKSYSKETRNKTTLSLQDKGESETQKLGSKNNLQTKQNKTKNYSGWRGGFLIKSTCHSCRGLEFSSQHLVPHRYLQPRFWVVYPLLAPVGSAHTVHLLKRNLYWLHLNFYIYSTVMHFSKCLIWKDWGQELGPTLYFKTQLSS